METPARALERAERLARLTTRYSRFSGTFGGLGTALCGLLGLGLMLRIRLGPPTALQPWLIGVLPAGILARELVRRLYYQHHGIVTEAQPRIRHVLRYVALGLFTAGCWGGVLWAIARHGFPEQTSHQIFLLGMTLAPILWGTPSGVIDLMLVASVFLNVLIAVSRHAPPRPSELTMPTVFSVAALAMGLYQHLEFRRLQRELAALHDDPTSPPTAPTSPSSSATRGLATLAALETPRS